MVKSGVQFKRRYIFNEPERHVIKDNFEDERLYWSYFNYLASDRLEKGLINELILISYRFEREAALSWNRARELDTGECLVTIPIASSIISGQTHIFACREWLVQKMTLCYTYIKLVR